MISIEKLKNLQKLVVDSSSHHQDDRKMTVTANQHVDGLFVLSFVNVGFVFVDTELKVERVNVDFGFEACDGPGDGHFSVSLLVVNVFDDHCGWIFNEWVATCEIVKLLKDPLALGDIAAYSFDEILFLLVKFPFDSSLSVWQHNHRQVMQVLIRPWLWHHD